MRSLVNKIHHVFVGGDARSSLVKKNILGAVALKGVAMLTSFVLVPLTIDYLDSEVYGIWLTITSILYWISFFDIGLGNGMRNYLSAAFAKGDMTMASKYISTTGVMLSLIAAFLMLVCYAILPLIDFQTLFNTSAISEELLRQAVTVAVMTTLMLFVVKIVGIIYIAMQLSAVNDLLGVLGHVLALAAVYILSQSTTGNLLYVVYAFTIPPIFVFAFASIPLFYQHKELRPSLLSVDWSLNRQIVGKGLGFFVIQMTSCLIIYGLSNVFIAHYCGPAAVTSYGVAYKFFNLLTVAFVIFITPFWNAYTDAYVKGNHQWIARMFRKSIVVLFLLILCGILMLCVAPWFYQIWVGENVQVPWTMSFVTLLYILAFNFTTCTSFLVNGLNKIYVQIIVSIFATILYLLMVCLVKGKYGAEGIIGSMAWCYMLIGAVLFYQDVLIIKKKANRFWNR